MSRYQINRTKYLNEEEQTDLVNTLKRFATTGSEVERRDATLLLLLLHTGGRANEVLGLTTSDLISEDESIFLRGSKGSNDRELPVPRWLFNLVRDEARKQTGAKVFPISYRRLVQIWEMYRPVVKKLHSLRHTYAINIFKKTRDLRLVQVALGHRNINNTMVYSEYIYQKDELRKALVG